MVKRLPHLNSSKIIRCPVCDGLMEMRRFMDGGEDGDINRDLWCSSCRLRWICMESEPMEAEE